MALTLSGPPQWPIAIMEYLDQVQHSFEHAWRDVKHGKADKETAITVGAGVAVLAGAYFLLRPKKYKKKPGASQLTGGGIDREKVQKEFDEYAKAYGDKPGEGITGRDRRAYASSLSTHLHDCANGCVY